MDFSLRIVERLPRYLQLACHLKETGHDHISSSILSKHFFIDQNNIKKDLSFLNLNGKPNKGYEINEFISAIKMVLGTTTVNRAIVVGAGNLGRAMSNYSNFANYGLKIVALFDDSPEIIGSTVDSFKILPLDNLSEVISKLGVKLAILTVPAKSAAGVAGRLYELGIRYFWNFAPVHLKLPDDAIVKSENLAASYMFLSYQINLNNYRNNGGKIEMVNGDIEKRIYEAFNKYAKSRDNLIPVLQDVQDIRGYISKDDIRKISEYLNIADSKVYGVATFYNQFKLTPPGHFQISVCRGTACHVKGSLNILNAVKEHLKINIGQTTRDKIFSLQEVACLGACSIAPVIMINDKFYGHLDVAKTLAIIDRLKAEYLETKDKGAAASAA
jgi:NADH-quinone oxidoreductase E subunit